MLKKGALPVGGIMGWVIVIIMIIVGVFAIGAIISRLID